jgi:outer membrane protein assembly factor BamB
MSGKVVETWQIAEAPCWVAGSGRLLVGPVGHEAWLLDPMRTDPVARVQMPALGGCITSGVAFVAGHGGEHAAIDVGDGHVVWRSKAPWNPATGARAAFARELFVADGQRLSVVPTGHTVTAPAPIEEVALIAGTLVVRASPNLLGYHRTLEPAWSIALGEFERFHIADNGRMLVVALERAGQLWLRGLLPTAGTARWNVLVPDAGAFKGHTVVGDLVQVESGTHRFVLRADTGQLMWSSVASAS